MSKITAVAAAALLVTALAGCADSGGDGGGEFPGSEPIEMVAHTSPGGGWDTVSRALGDHIPTYLEGATVEVLNRTGGAGLEQYGYVTGTQDGHRIGPLPLPGIVSAAMVNPDTIDLERAHSLGSVSEDPYVVAASKASGITSIDDLVSRDEVTVGSSGGAGGDHFINVQLESFSGASWDYVNHEGSTEATLAAIRGDVDIVTQPLGTMEPNLADPNLVPLVIFSDEPAEEIPDVPVAGDVAATRDFADLGRIYRAFMVAEGTPEATVQALQDAVRSVAEDPEFVEQMATAGHPVTYRSPEETGDILDRLRTAAEENADAF